MYALVSPWVRCVCLASSLPACWLLEEQLGCHSVWSEARPAKWAALTCALITCDRPMQIDPSAPQPLGKSSLEAASGTGRQPHALGMSSHIAPASSSGRHTTMAPAAASHSSGALPSSASSSSFSSVAVRPPRPCASLTDLCLQHYRAHLEEIGNLQNLPETLVQQLLYIVYVEGGLTPPLVKLFAASQHESIQRWIAANIQLDRAMMINSTANCRAYKY